MHSSKSRQTLPHSETFKAIGTSWQIDTSDSIPPAIATAMHDCIAAFDMTYSRFRTDSLVTKIAKQSGTYTFPDDVIPMINFYRSLYDITGGKVTPLIGIMLEKAGYDANYSFRQQVQSALPGWDAAMKWKSNILTVNKPALIDIGAAGKGYLIDQISTILDQDGIEEYVIDASGDILHKGPSETIIGLEHPEDPSKVIGTIPVQNGSLCASASNRRSWGEGMHHIFDPDTMEPTREIIATWVTADKAMIADGIATALFFTDPAKLAQAFEFDYVRMHNDGSVDYSSKFKGALFT